MCSPVLLSLPCCVSFVMGPVRVAPFSSARLLQACHATGVPPCVAEAQPRFCAHVATAPVLPRPQRAPVPPTVPVPPTPRPVRDAPSHTAPGGGGGRCAVRTGPGVAGGVWPNRCRAGGTEARVSRSKASVTDGGSGQTSSSSAGAGPLCPGPLAPAVTPSGRADAGVGRRLGGGDRGGGAAFPAAPTLTPSFVSPLSISPSYKMLPPVSDAFPTLRAMVEVLDADASARCLRKL